MLRSASSARQRIGAWSRQAWATAAWCLRAPLTVRTAGECQYRDCGHLPIMRADNRRVKISLHHHSHFPYCHCLRHADASAAAGLHTAAVDYLIRRGHTQVAAEVAADTGARQPVLQLDP